VATELSGTVRVIGDSDATASVVVSLEDEVLALNGASGEIGHWPLKSVGINSRSDGFHLKVEGEELVLRTSDDARFALAVGLQASSSPRLTRAMAHARDVESAPEPVEEPAPQPVEGPSLMGWFIVAASGLVLIAALVAYGSDGELLGFIPVWSAMLATALVLAAGGFALMSELRAAPLLIGVGVVLGLVTLVASLTNPSAGSAGMILLAVGTLGSGAILAFDRFRRAN
jgi:hypothetical protein